MSLSIKHLMTPIEGGCERWAYFWSRTQETLTAENYQKTESKAEFVGNLNKAIDYHGKQKEKWKCNAFHFSLLQAALVAFLVFLSFKDKEIPNTLLKKKHIRIGPKLKVSMGLMGGLELAQQVCKYISTYYKHRKKFLEKELEKINRISTENSST